MKIWTFELERIEFGEFESEPCSTEDEARQQLAQFMQRSSAWSELCYDNDETEVVGTSWKDCEKDCE